MYSVVLLMAVTSGGEAAEFGGRRGCRASCGGCYDSCGGCSRSCARAGRRAKGCRGCHAVSYCGCHSYGGGCYGGYAYGGCYGGAVVYSGCYGGGAAPGAKMAYGGIVGSGTDVAIAEGDDMRPGTPLSASEQTMLKEMMDAEKTPAEKAKIEEEFKKDSRAGRRATYEVFKKGQANKEGTTAMIIVTVPEAATVKIDGENTLSTSTVRRFESPELAKGKTYSYTFVAEYQQDGRPVTVQKKVSFHAGQAVRLDLTAGGTAVASR